MKFMIERESDPLGKWPPVPESYCRYTDYGRAVWYLEVHCLRDFLKIVKVHGRFCFDGYKITLFDSREEGLLREANYLSKEAEKKKKGRKLCV